MTACRGASPSCVPDTVPLVTRPFPPEIGSMTWHPRLDGDPARSWLRDAIRAAARAIDLK